MDGSILQTTFLEILADTSKLKPALDGVERQTSDVGSKVERAINQKFGKPIDDVSKRFTLARSSVSNDQSKLRQVRKSSTRNG